MDGHPPREAAAYGGTSAQEDLLWAYGCSRGARKFFTLISKAGPNVVESAANLTEFVPFRRSGALGYIGSLISVCQYYYHGCEGALQGSQGRKPGTPGYQLGHYEMTGKPGVRRSIFKVLVHLGEHADPDATLEAWREDVERAQQVGREKTAARVEAKIRELEGAISDIKEVQ